ncbi:H-type lectin domain-containing protein [uncultured Phascolarctobacterium sp.]|uniref:H-type lectin domain-containing protein n=1 Tax=uncultured Phascolarctobacterium sp. TaxID=512296 RepID=UPI0025FC0DBE|nr:H-type lectin domain-containing protein [uncultured Phascolarctobacterium sp.]
MDVDKLIQHIPNNVSGDGKPFVAALKKALIKYREDLNKKIDDSTADAGEKPGHVSSVQLLELHSINDGVRVNSIQVSWVKTTVTNYAKAEVWFRTATDKAWEKAGESSGTQFVYSGATTGLTYYIKVVAVNTKGNTADFDTAPQASIKIQGSQYIPNPPTQFVLTWDEKGPLWKWLFEPNEYIDFFELRLDQNPGVWNDKRLDSTRETWSRANPGVRSGTAYLYIRNIFGEYSEPAVHEFSKALPQKPTAPQLTSTIDGVRIKMQGLPLGATGYKIHIKTVDSTETVEDDFYTVNSEYIYFFFIGHITVKYCFVDPLGDGEWSDTTEADCKAGIDIGQVPTIDYTKFDKFTQDAIDKANNQPSINDALKKLITDNTTAINEANKLIDANANGIHQNADSISSVMTKVNGLNEKVEGIEGTVTTQGTAIVQTATDITALAKRVTVNEGTISTNTSSIQQNADSITSVVKRVDDAEGTLKTHGTAIQQNANSISTIAMDVKGNASAIEQNAKSITAIVEDVKGNKASIQANADNIASIVTNVDKQGSAIVQNANSITSVVTELNKKPADCNYSSINQLQDDILLCVKKDGVINAINVSTEGIVIDGNKVHITGDTVFDKNVIVGGMIAADSIALEHLKANSVSSAKIQANAITSTKIDTGAVTADKIEAGAITAEKLAADSVTSDAIQAGSVIGDKIAANTITGKHFAAANIDLTGALTITGGNVKLSQEGLRLSSNDGSFTLFNQEGINYVDASGIVYAQVTKMIIGVAYDGQRVKFNAPWPKVPQIFVSPTSLMVNNADYSQNNIFIVCSATDITNEGFKVNCYSCLGQDSKGLVVINKSITGYKVSKTGENVFMNFTIVVPSSAGSITVAGYVHNIPWNSYSSVDEGVDKGHGVSNFYAEISGDGVASTTPFHYGPDTDADKHEWACDFSVTAKLSGATQVTFRAYGTHTDTNNYNSAYDNGGGLSMSVPSATFDVDSDVVVSRGYANFMVVDNSSTTYTLETQE